MTVTIWGAWTVIITLKGTIFSAQVVGRCRHIILSTRPLMSRFFTSVVAIFPAIPRDHIDNPPFWVLCFSLFESKGVNVSLWIGSVSSPLRVRGNIIVEPYECPPTGHLDITTSPIVSPPYRSPSSTHPILDTDPLVIELSFSLCSPVPSSAPCIFFVLRWRGGIVSDFPPVCSHLGLEIGVDFWFFFQHPGCVRSCYWWGKGRTTPDS